MKIPLLIVTMAGIAIGLAIPAVKTAAPPVAAAVPTPVTPSPPAAPPSAPPPPAAAPPVDTVLDRSPGGHFIAVADVNGEPTRFVVDTGADTVALTMADATRAHIAFDPTQFRVVGRGASGDVRGQEVQIDRIVLDGKEATALRGVVLEGSDISLLGHSYLRSISDVQIKGDKMILR
jgi:aspartyl protease family protein